MNTKQFFIISILLALFPILGRAQEIPQWSCDIHAYQYDMTLYLSIQENGSIANGNKTVAIFHQEECRGVAELLTFGNTNCFYLRARSNQEKEEVLTFKVYDSHSGQTLIPSATIAFKAEQQTGFPSDPFIVALPQLITPDNTGSVSATTEEIQLSGEWNDNSLTTLSEQLRGGEDKVNEELETFDLSQATFNENVTLKGVFQNFTQLTTVILPDLPQEQNQLSPEAFAETNPNCIVYLTESTEYPEEWDQTVNVVVGDNALQLNLVEHNPFHISKAFTAERCTYRRTFSMATASLRSSSSPHAFTNDGWETLCIPFPVERVTQGEKVLMPITQSDDLSNGDYYRATLTAEGFQLVSDQSANPIYFEANVPYLINMKPLVTDPTMQEVEVLFSREEPFNMEMSVSSYPVEEGSLTLTGTFSKPATSSQILALNSVGNAFVKETTANPFEAYLTTTAEGISYLPLVPMTMAITNVPTAPIQAGASVTLTGNATPSLTDMPAIAWESSDPSIATVSASGVVTGLKAGTVTITAFITGNPSIAASCTINVEKKETPEDPDPENPPVDPEDPDDPDDPSDPDDPDDPDDPSNPEDPDDPTDVEEIQAAVKIHAQRQTLVIDCATPTHITIIEMTGVTLYDNTLTGTNFIPMPRAGIYLVKYAADQTTGVKKIAVF